MKYANLTFLMLIACLSARSQSPISDAAGLAHSVNVPVNLYNGSTSIDVPLYSIAANNGATVPIGLSYNASGIKVNDPASSVGLGWDLYAGGSITRIVRGKPDIATASTNPDVSSLSTVMSQVYAGKDSERDMFYFSYPGGGGKFILDENLTDIYTLPYSDIDIAYDNVNDKFTIRDLSGNEYIFDQKESGVFNQTSGSTYTSPDISYTATWHLSKINFLNLPDSKGISFLYSSLGLSSGERFIAYKDVQAGCNGNSYTETGSGELKIKTETYGKRLSKIIFPKGEVIFNFDGSDREDLPGSKRLRSIQVEDNDDEIVLKYVLNTSYFNAGDSFYKNDTYNDKNGGSCTAPECKRLKLESIDQVMGGQTINYRTFDYMNDKNFHASQGWDLYELPPRDSEYYDHWGYFTHDNTTTYNEYTLSPYNSGGNNFTVLGMNRSPTIYVLANLLNKVTLPGGGYTTIEYETHGMSWGSGARIKKVETFDENNVRVGGKSYTYTGGQTGDPIVYGIKIGSVYDFCFNTSTQSYEDTPVDLMRFYSYSLTNFLDLNGPNVGYDQVTETDLMGSGRVEHYFLNFSDRAEPDAVKHEYTASAGGGTQGALLSADGPPFSGTFMTYYDRGAEKLTKIYDQAGTLLRESETYFTQETAVENTQKNVMAFHEQVSGSSKKYLIAEYTIKSRPVIVTRTRNKTYEGAQSIETNTYYYYHSTYPTLIERVESVDANGDRYKNTTRYHHDIITSTIATNAASDLKGLDALRVNKANGIAIETISSLKKGAGSYYYLGASLSTFKEYGTTDKFVARYQSRSLALAAPSASFSETTLNGAKTAFVIDSGYRVMGTLNSYDANGNLTSSTGSDGVTTTFAYDAAGDYLLSSTSNSMTTSYEYYPLIGVKKVTDANGNFVTNEYDIFNRLRLVRDQDGNILKRNRYHLAQEDESLGGSITYTGLQQINKPITFTSNNTYSFYGKTRYVWDFGDGVVVETSNPNAGHTYTQGGDYTVKLTLINPEYDPVQVLKLICISPDSNPCTLPE